MKRKTVKCGLCEKSNLASICAVCVDSRLNDYRNYLNSLKNIRDSRYSRLTSKLAAKSKADDQLTWNVHQNEKLARLRAKLKWTEEQLSQGKAKLDKTSNVLKIKQASLNSAILALQKNRVEQLEKYYPNIIHTQSLVLKKITSERRDKQSVVIKNISRLFPQRRVIIEGNRKDGSNGQYDQIGNARLPRGLDPHSVSSEELAASLGYMVQLLNLVVQYLAAPALHVSGFAGSCSRIWQRDSYWDARPSSRSNEFPLFIPRQDSCAKGGEYSWSDRNSSSFGVASIESETKISGSGSFNFYSASPHSVETHKDLQKGISLLKKSVACVTAYCYNSLCLGAPPEGSIFEVFAKLLETLSSSEEVPSVFSLKVASSRPYKQVQHLNRSVSLVNSGMSSKSVLESAYETSVKRNAYDNNFSNSAVNFHYINQISDVENHQPESLVDEWDLVEHPTLPPPSQNEDIEHWTRAMFIDATRR